MAAIWNGAAFRDPCLCSCPIGGGEASAALVIGSTPLQIKFKRNRKSTSGPSGPAWIGDGAAVAVGNLGSSASKKIAIRQMPDSTRLFITNGLDVHFFSDDDGATWNPW